MRRQGELAADATLRWWVEVAGVVGAYLAYSLVRSRFGTTGHAAGALVNAYRVVALERRVGMFSELSIQRWAMRDATVVRLLNAYYGSAHFVVTALVGITLFRRSARRYRFWRRCLAVTTALALVGYAVFPLAPPRLLPARYGFVDTLTAVGGLWDFGSGPMGSVANQYAAMPSLHVAWAVWCVAAAWSLLGARGRILLGLHPLVTLWAVVATANHYWLDGVVAVLVLTAGVVVVALPGRLTRRVAVLVAESRS